MQWPWVSREYKEKYQHMRADVESFSKLMHQLHGVLTRAEKEDVDVVTPESLAWRLSMHTNFYSIRVGSVEELVQYLRGKLEQELNNRHIRELAQEAAREECGEDEE